jgi:protoheme ferro-lyase
MTTKVIGIKAFRQNMTKLWKKGRKEKVRFIVMNHSVPVMEVNPIDEDELFMKMFAKDIEEALKQVDEGKVYTAEEVRRKLKL